MLKLKLFKALKQFDLDVDIEFESARVIGVFGDSGAGKSTLLRCISGFEKQQQHVVIDQQPLHDLAIDKRGITLQLQSCPLFPHLDVAGNLAFTFKHCARKTPITINNVVVALNLQSLLNRRVAELSGGEAQRVNFARTLLTGQKTLLLDEPFSALDWQSRYKILNNLMDFASNHGIRFIIVSHSLKELVFCCDHLIHLDKGKVKAYGKTTLIAQLLYKQKHTSYSMLECTQGEYLADFDVYPMQLNNSEQTLWVSKAIAQQGNRLVIQSDDIVISASKYGVVSTCNSLKTTLINKELVDGAWHLTLQVAEQLLHCQVSRIAMQNHMFNINDTLYATINKLDS
jgi:molybdate transport system ATP-binding protein